MDTYSLWRVIRLLYYLPMERMIRRIAIRKDWTISMSEFRNFAEKYQWEINELEEENKKLNEKIAHLEFDIEAWKKLKAVWEKKEQKLQIEIWWLMWERDGLKMVVDKLKEENQTLELWLDNKEKLNKGYRKQIDKLRTDNIYEEWLYD